jgi:hypothetical protein
LGLDTGHAGKALSIASTTGRSLRNACALGVLERAVLTTGADCGAEARLALITVRVSPAKAFLCWTTKAISQHTGRTAGAILVVTATAFRGRRAFPHECRDRTILTALAPGGSDAKGWDKAIIVGIASIFLWFRSADPGHISCTSNADEPQ